MSTRRLRVTVDGQAYEVEVEFLDDDPTPSSATPVGVPTASASVTPPAASPRPAPSASRSGAPGQVTAPMAGTVVKVHVKPGQVVSAGQVVVTLEAMKMNTEITAPEGGTVSAVEVHDGAVVGEGALLLRLTS